MPHNYQNTIAECKQALSDGKHVYAKDQVGDWLKIDAIRDDGAARVADSLSGLNSELIGAWRYFRDYEVQ